MGESSDPKPRPRTCVPIDAWDAGTRSVLAPPGRVRDAWGRVVAAATVGTVLIAAVPKESDDRDH